VPDACCTPSELPQSDSSHSRCPSCERHGRSVSLRTVQAQVSLSLRALAADRYAFCATVDCPVVYFAAGTEPITHQQLRERVFQKAPAGDTLVCYCFRHTVAALEASDAGERAAILADIIAGTREGQCACELRNPQGRCCLGNVRELLRVATLQQENVP
jgi:hypothetical protein